MPRYRVRFPARRVMLEATIEADSIMQLRQKIQGNLSGIVLHVFSYDVPPGAEPMLVDVDEHVPSCDSRGGLDCDCPADYRAALQAPCTDCNEDVVDAEWELCKEDRS